MTRDSLEPDVVQGLTVRRTSSNVARAGSEADFLDPAA